MEQQEGARRIVRDCIGIKPDDQVLLITDTGRPPWSRHSMKLV